MSSFTIHALDTQLDVRLAERARLAGISKNQLIKNLLAQATGLPVDASHADDYREFCGVWSVAEHAEFQTGQSDNERVDSADWSQ